MPDPTQDHSSEDSREIPAFAPGQQLSGGYTLKSILDWGTGPGVGVTWAARDEMEKDVALHILPAGILQDAAAMSSLRGLVKRSRGVIHPNIVRIHELIEEPDWTALRMDFVEGETLSALQAKKEKGCFDPEEIKPWVSQLCETLRDGQRVGLPLEVAPANLILSPSGRLTAVSYRSQAAATPAETVHSLGVLLYELLAGKPPSLDGDAASPVSARRGELGLAPILEEWESVIAACLEKDAGKRPASVMEVAKRLGVEGDAPVAPAPATASVPAPLAEPEPTPQPEPQPDANAVTVSMSPVPTSAKQIGSGVSAERASGSPSGGEERQGCKFPGLAVLAVLVLIVIVAMAVYFANNGTGPTAASGTPSPAATATPAAPAETPTPTKAPSPSPAPSTPMPTPTVAKPALPSPSATGASDKELARHQAETALQDALKNADDKTKRVEAAKQSALEASNLSDQKLQARQAAEAAAASAQQSAQEKGQASQAAEKAAAEAAGEAKNQAAILQKAQADLADAQTKVDETRRVAVAAEAAAGAAEAEASASASPGKPALPVVSPEPSIKIMRAEPVLPLKASNTPTLNIQVPNPQTPIERTLVNSLGMKFAPVGNVLFSIWVTRVKDFAAFADATGYSSTAWKDPGFAQGPDHPVVYVSWEDATAFCKWLTEKEHKAGLLTPNQYYRLPTDLEWSKAVGLQEETGATPEARDMDVPSVFPWGTQWPPPAGAGNYTGEETNSDVAIKGYNDGYIYTSPVGAFAPNKLGLYDVGGNVSQWCVDSWNSEQRAKVLRGGSWYNGALRLSLLSSCRVHAPPETSTDNWGFRCVIAKESGNGSHK